MRILVIEDDQQISDNIEKRLLRENFAVDRVFDGEEGEYMASVERYDVIVLDINLPEMDGWEVTESLREQSNSTPILMLTAYGEIEDRVKGLNLGADDYLSKPFSMDELVARIHALIRRNSSEGSPIIEVGSLKVDPLKHTVKRHEETIELTAKEFAVLEFLARNKGNVVTRTMILDHVWGSEFETLSNVVDVYIKNLRKKIDTEGEEKLLHTIRGKGYVLDERRNG